MTTTTADITISNGNYERTDLGILAAKVWQQGAFYVARYIGPDERIVSRHATRETAEAVALRHTMKL